MRKLHPSEPKNIKQNAVKANVDVSSPRHALYFSYEEDEIKYERFAIAIDTMTEKDSDAITTTAFGYIAKGMPTSKHHTLVSSSLHLAAMLIRPIAINTRHIFSF